MAKFDIKQYARWGAAARVAELQGELSEIYRAFPDLRRGGRTAMGPGRGSEVGNGRATARGNRKPMSAAARKAVSARMKKYWAQRRAQSGKSK